MASNITYTWNFNPLESYPTASGETDVVFLVHWQLYASTGSYTASSIGTQNVAPYDGSNPFIPFQDLTYDTVYNWVSASMEEQNPGVIDRMYESLAQQIENQINPPVLVQQAPWLAPPPVLVEPEVVVEPTVEPEAPAEEEVVVDPEVVVEPPVTE
jgi:hypothetical protein